MKRVYLILIGLGLSLSLSAQESTGPSEEDLAKANNPLASLTALNLHNYYVPNVYGDSDATLNTTWLRLATPTGRILWRASLPFRTVSTSTTDLSGMGDFDLFAAYLLKSDATFTFGIGPSVGAPTASNDQLGSGKWTGGLTAVIFKALSPKVQVGGLITWRGSFAGDADRDEVQFAAVQPFYFFQLGQGLYVRGAPIWSFNLENDTYSIPIGLGLGKVLKTDKVVFNFFAEPQFTALHYGAGQPAIQLFFGLNTQF